MNSQYFNFQPLQEYKLSQPVWRALYDPLHSQYAAVITHPGPHADINPHIWEISPKCEVSQYNILESSDGPVIEARVRSDDGELSKSRVFKKLS